jgi:thermopsin
VVLLFAFSGLGLGTGLPAMAPTAAAIATPTGHSGAGLPAGSLLHSTVASPLSNGTPPSAVSQERARSAFAMQAVEAAAAEGIPSKFVYVPRPGAPTSQLRQAEATGHITPSLCGGCPGPMGIADWGIRNATNGSLEAYTLNTTSLRGTFQAGPNGVQPLYVFDSSPDAYSVQLNAVLADTSVAGNSSYQFWTQNVAVYYATSHLLYLVSNVWNFSSEYFANNTILSHGPHGNVSPGRFYWSEMLVSGVSYPFNITLYLNSTVFQSKDDAVNFSAVLGTPGATRVYPFDDVVFNSTGAGGPGVSGPAAYRADGRSYNPLGLADDFELVVGGPGGGSQVNLFDTHANLTLQYAQSPAVYASVPSAYSYGGDSGESSSGANVEWTNGSVGPVATMSTGPSILAGLWGAGGNPGISVIPTAVQPTSAFVFVQPASNNFTLSEPEWSPTALDTNISLSPGSYIVTAMLSYYASVTEGPTSFPPGTSAPFNPSLPANSGSGVTTPIWVWNDSQFPALSSSGNGTNQSPYMIQDQQVAAMPAIFGAMNDYQFPVFSGVFFAFTHRSAELYRPGSFETNLPSAWAGFPSTNDLPYTFYNVSNVSVVDAANISGWFSYGLYYHPGNYSYATFNMVFWNSTHNLVAGNTFNTEGEGIYLYGGSGNTIWNNTIRWGPSPTASFPNLWPSELSVGIQVGESGDLVYNNAIYTNTTAITPTFDLYTGHQEFYKDAWNITKTTDLGYTRYAPGFDIPLYGEIVAAGYQGGNFWWDYGQPSNPNGSLPYSESHRISYEGDFVPLVLNFTVTFVAKNYTASLPWSVNLTNYLGAKFNTSGSSYDLLFASLNDSLYFYSVVPPLGWASAPISGAFPLFENTTIVLVFSPIVNGSLVGTLSPASARLFADGLRIYDNVTTGAFNASLAPRSWTLSAVANGYMPYSAVVTIASSQTNHTNITLTPFDGTVVGTVSPASAAVAVGGVVVAVSPAGTFSRSVPQGTYTVEGVASGYATASVSVDVSANNTTYVNLTLQPLTHHAAGLSALDWELIGISSAAVIVVLAVVLVRLQRGRSPPGSPPETAAAAVPAAPSTRPKSPPPPAARGP